MLAKTDSGSRMHRILPEPGTDEEPSAQAGHGDLNSEGSRIPQGTTSFVALKDFLRSPDFLEVTKLTSRDGRGGPWIHSTAASMLFGFIIFLNAVMLGIETDAHPDPDEFSMVFFACDSFFNSAFVLELFLRLRADRWLFWCDAWNIFDFALVLVGVVDTWIFTPLGSSYNVGFMSVMRTIRLVRLLKVLRIIRLIRFFRELMLLMAGICSAVKSMIWGLALLMLTIFLCSLFLTRMLRSKGNAGESNADFYEEYFSSIPRTSFTLFMFTMEFQPDVCKQSWHDGPWLTFFFVIYVAFTNITLLGVVTSVVVESIMGISAKGIDEHVQSIFSEIDHDADGRLTMDDLSPNAPLHRTVSKALNSAGITTDDARELFGVLDIDKSGCISRQEFVDGILRVRAAPQAKHVLKLEAKVEKVDRRVEEVRNDVHMLDKKVDEAIATVASLTHAIGHLSAVRGRQASEAPGEPTLPGTPHYKPSYIGSGSAGSGEPPSGMSRGSSSSLAPCTCCGQLELACRHQPSQADGPRHAREFQRSGSSSSFDLLVAGSGAAPADVEPFQPSPSISSMDPVLTAEPPLQARSPPEAALPTSELQQLRSQVEELKGLFIATLQPKLTGTRASQRLVTATVELSTIASSAHPVQTEVHAAQPHMRDGARLAYLEQEQGAGAHCPEMPRALREGDVARTTLEVLS